MEKPTSYDLQATQFLNRTGIKLRITLSDSKPARWTPSGHHYRITLSGKNPGMSSSATAKRRVVFDYWGSAHDAEHGRDPSAYQILGCIAVDIQTPGTFEEFCREFGGDTDSIGDKQNFRRCKAHADRLKVFFLPDEIDELQDIQ